MDDYKALADATEYMQALGLLDDPEWNAVFQEAIDSGEWDEATGQWRIPPWTPDQFRARIKLTKAYRRPFPVPPGGWPETEPRRSWWRRLLRG